jgi:hypothetical protein
MTQLAYFIMAPLDPRIASFPAFMTIFTQAGNIPAEQ